MEGDDGPEGVAADQGARSIDAGAKLGQAETVYVLSLLAGTTVHLIDAVSALAVAAVATVEENELAAPSELHDDATLARVLRAIPDLREAVAALRDRLDRLAPPL